MIVGSQRGFTLLEVMIAISIAALLVAVSVPAASKMYEAMAYRTAVRDVRSTLESARLQAMSKGHFVDVLVRPRDRQVFVEGGKVVSIPEALSLSVTAAEQLQRDRDTAVVRFYSDGMSSGGAVSLLRAKGAGVSIEVGWLLGEVKQHAIAP
ncbi:prepilin-type N-terminal cleavage/methylation domain-containing protein [Gilvimarinus algae]|uniref:Prepilin-type N-terminal cleavage/methylation domain-containing protein n=1 Tax=Gilvimarinus algae TaxID=3058037 RepID=A0ABT8TJA6_9GAMM|nr:GspH/FimT family pseudopilin [Gilvimarinus sp. SDUM040014]MDO3383574.1 prepilin-type N-terminal cleavage/methylation domain-containing protein [Gilvimarinus sp. SDUM040014]